jgi:hypothetical protein
MIRFSILFFTMLLCQGPFFTFGIVGVVKKCLMVNHLHSAGGIVSDKVVNVFADENLACTPSNRSKTVSGKISFFTDNTGARPAVCQKEGEVVVLKNQSMPAGAQEKSFREIWLEDASFRGKSTLLFLFLRFLIPKESVMGC